MLKLAATDVGLFKTTMQVPDDPEHAPDQPANELPEFGVAKSVTVAPALNGALQVVPQLIPGGLLVIVPPGLAETLNWTVAAWDA